MPEVQAGEVIWTEFGPVTTEDVDEILQYMSPATCLATRELGPYGDIRTFKAMLFFLPLKRRPLPQ